jgi:hypothetical protein
MIPQLLLSFCLGTIVGQIVYLTTVLLLILHHQLYCDLIYSFHLRTIFEYFAK